MTPAGRILIVDDELSLRQTLARVLQRTGYDVTTAESGEQALAFLETAAYDLVYLDIRMPGLGGLEVLQRIHARHPEVPVVLFTAQPDLNSSLEALRSGAADYLLKPLKPETIIEKTGAILSARQKERRKGEIRAEIDALQSELRRLEAADSSARPPDPGPPASDRFLKRGPLVLDLHTRRLLVDGRAADLPPAAFDYLTVLARHAPDVVDYRTLAAEAQGLQAEAREAQELVKWHIHHIRQAIEKDAQNPSRLYNVRGIGYRLIAD
ncbi:MAG: response regulator transcription factor [Anaerolineales bacterium]|nr:response regulator transcription factor [Anaerolineales bacterium]